MKITRLDYLSAYDIDTKLTKQSNISLARLSIIFRKKVKPSPFLDATVRVGFFVWIGAIHLQVCGCFFGKMGGYARAIKLRFLHSTSRIETIYLVRYFWAEWHSINLFDLIEIHASFIKNRKIPFHFPLFCTKMFNWTIINDK